MGYYRKPRVETVTIANGGTTSAAILLRDYVLASIITPAALTSTAITFTASDTKGGSYVQVNDSDGNQVSLVAAASRSLSLSGAEADALAACLWVKVVTGSAEGAERILKLILK